MPQYKNNHYVPQWYQEGFIPANEPVRNLFYLDLIPDMFSTADSRRITDRALKIKGPSKCFSEDDLYTRWFGDERNTQVEDSFFGRIDRNAIKSVRYFENFDHTAIDYEAYQNMMPYLGSQRIRTPRGLSWLSNVLGISDKSELMRAMVFTRDHYSAVWSEGIWQIADANESDTKFIISDNPITVYNKEIGTHNRTWDRDKSDPDPNLMGSHTIFPLSMNKVLILTHPGWAKNPFQNGMVRRPNINPYRPTVFNYTQIQVDRHLSEDEVRQFNFILKNKAQRYIAAYKKEWLYPERHVNPNGWKDFGDGLLMLPDPRSLNVGGNVFVGFNDGSSYAQDQWGRPPDDSRPNDVEWNTLHKIQGIFAHKFGPLRRGRSFDMGNFETEEDTPQMHELFLNRYKPRGSEAKKLKLLRQQQQRLGRQRRPE
jgi:hypothetical protein